MVRARMMIQPPDTPTDIPIAVLLVIPCFEDIGRGLVVGESGPDVVTTSPAKLGGGATVVPELL
jgi:hypothetical protein